MLGFRFSRICALSGGIRYHESSEPCDLLESREQERGSSTLGLVFERRWFARGRGDVRLFVRGLVGSVAGPDERALTLKDDAAGTAFVVVAIVPAVETISARSERILRDGNMLLRGVPPPGITRGIVGSNMRVCGCHDGMTIFWIRLF